MGTASCTWLRQVQPFNHYAATKGFAGYLSHAISHEVKSVSRQRDGTDPSLIEISCVTPFGVATNLVKSPLKEEFMQVYTNSPASFGTALERNVAQYFTTYGNLYMDIMTKLGFNMAAKYMPQIFDSVAPWFGSFVATYDHEAARKGAK